MLFSDISFLLTYPKGLYGESTKSLPGPSFLILVRIRNSRPAFFSNPTKITMKLVTLRLVIGKPSFNRNGILWGEITKGGLHHFIFLSQNFVWALHAENNAGITHAEWTRSLKQRF